MDSVRIILCLPMFSFPFVRCLVCRFPARCLSLLTSLLLFNFFIPRCGGGVPTILVYRVFFFLEISGGVTNGRSRATIVK